MTKEQRQQAETVLEALVKQTALHMDKWVVPDDKIQPLQDFVTKTFLKHPKMKPERVARKAAEYFRFKKWNKVDAA